LDKVTNTTEQAMNFLFNFDWESETNVDFLQKKLAKYNWIFIVVLVLCVLIY